MKRILNFLLLITMVVSMMGLTGCTQEVPPGTIGRINTAAGWQDEILKPGRHTCWGRDTLYLIDVTNKAFPESMKILVGGKVNLTVNFSVRVHANDSDAALIKKAFESITADKDHKITVDQMYKTFLQMKALAIPREVFEIQPDIQTAVASSPELAKEIRKQIQEVAKSTPLTVDDAEITNYDWPDTITNAQEALVGIQLREAAADAQVRADLKKAEGDLKVEGARKLVEIKKAEAVAESIDIIKKKLAGSPEYLMWHQIRVMGEAANGPNNAFILYPYATDAGEVQRMMGNANLTQMLKADKTKADEASTK
jgi:hypothetical protein